MRTQEELDSAVSICEVGLALAERARDRNRRARMRMKARAPSAANAWLNFADASVDAGADAEICERRVGEAAAALKRARDSAVAGPNVLIRAAAHFQTWQRQEALLALIAAILLVNILRG